MTNGRHENLRAIRRECDSLKQLAPRLHVVVGLLLDLAEVSFNMEEGGLEACPGTIVGASRELRDVLGRIRDFLEG